MPVGYVEKIPPLGAGVATTSPDNAHSTTFFNNVEDGLIAGTFAQLKAGVLSKMDTTPTPNIVGIALRTYCGGMEFKKDTDAGIDIVDFGRASVTVKAGVTPKVGAKAFASTDAATAGQAQDTATAGVEVPNAIFYRELSANVWEVTIQNLKN